jgi:hypothetical protein
MRSFYRGFGVGAESAVTAQPAVPPIPDQGVLSPGLQANSGYQGWGTRSLSASPTDVVNLRRDANAQLREVGFKQSVDRLAYWQRIL